MIMGAVVATVIAVFVLEFRAAGGQQTGSLRRQCVARVAGECLGIKDYNAALALIVPAGVSAKQVKSLELRKHVLAGLVERELLIHQAEQIGVSVTPEALDNELAAGRAHVSLPGEAALRLGMMLDLIPHNVRALTGETVRELPVVNPKTGQFDLDIYNRVVRNTARRSPKEFKMIQRREIVAERMRELVRSRVRLAENEAFEAFARERSRAVVRLVKLQRDWFARYATDSSEEAIKGYAKKHPTQIEEAWKDQQSHFVARCPLVDEILVQVPADAAESDKTLLREKIDQAVAHLDAGEDFGAVAREVSDASSAAIGGELGCLTKDAYGEGADVLLDAIANLSPGTTTKVLESKRGFHVLRYRGKLTESPETYGRRLLTKERAVSDQADEKLKEFGDALLSAAKSGAKLDDTTKAMVPEYAGDWAKPRKPTKKDVAEEEPVALRDTRRPKVEISAPFSAEENPILEAMPPVSPATIAFSLSKPDEVHPELIPLVGGFAVLQLKEKELATRDEFEKDKGDIMRQLLVSKQADAVARYVTDLRERMKKDIEVNTALVEDSSKANDEE